MSTSSPMPCADPWPLRRRENRGLKLASFWSALLDIAVTGEHGDAQRLPGLRQCGEVVLEPVPGHLATLVGVHPVCDPRHRVASSLAPNQARTCSGLVSASKTSSAGASNCRVISTSRSFGNSTVAEPCRVPFIALVPFVAALGGSHPSGPAGRSIPARTWSATRASAGAARAPGGTAGDAPPPGS